jgi:LacI family transcriptional regulator
MEPQPKLLVVANDNRSGGAQATQHLLDQGRRTIGLITGPLNWWEARERYAGWKDTLLRAGLEPSPSLVVEGDWSAPSGERGMRTLLTQRPDIDAVFACNDQMALGALIAARVLGRQVPQDLAIVGFDNIPESAYFWPPLTTVYQRLVDVGRTAVQVLHKLIEAGQQGEESTGHATIMLKPELVIRQSSLVGLQPVLIC